MVFFIALSFLASVQASWAQRFALFSQEVKTEYPSVVYDFLETYLFQIDSLQRAGSMVDQRLRDDKVYFMTGSAACAKQITEEMPFEIMSSDDKFYEVIWTDTTGNTFLDIAFPMQYELLLGKPKVDIEKDLKSVVWSINDYMPLQVDTMDMQPVEDGCLMSKPLSHYYVESLNTAIYYSKKDMTPTFSDADKWHSAANLFHGCIEEVEGYSLYVEQSLYGFKTTSFTVPLKNWLAYCQAMKLKTYFSIEEERGDGLKALLIAQSVDLGFNHMLSIIIPGNFVTNRSALFKVTLNAYIPTQNVKNLYH